MRQIAGLDLDRVRQTYRIPADFEPVAGLAIGRPARGDALLDDLRQRGLGPRRRRSLQELVFEAEWGRPAAWLPAPAPAANVSETPCLDDRCLDD